MARPQKTETQETNNKQEIDTIDVILSDKKFKDFHHGSRSLGDELKQDVISTGSFWFDYILGGGFRSGSWARFYGSVEGGKTSQGLCWGRNWQNFYPDNGFVIYFNAEGRLSKDLVERSGINTDPKKWRVIDSNKADFLYYFIETTILNNKEGRKYFFIVDSTDSLERTVDMKKNLGEAEKIGGGATIASAAGKRLSLLFNAKGGHFLYICSQMREKMNMMHPGASGKDASGGWAYKFYSSLIGEIRQTYNDDLIFENPSESKSKIIGRKAKIKLHKTPNESTGQTVVVPVKYGLKGGVWRAYEAMMASQAWGIYKNEKQGWFNLEKSFAEELSEKGISFESNVHGEKQLRDLFDNNLQLTEYVLDKCSELFK